MDIPETILLPPDEFLFPYTPYEIQKNFMRNLYEALEGRKLGIFESPTGTGKSMSVICASLKWLFDAQERLKQDIKLNIEKFDDEVRRPTSGVNWLEERELLQKNLEKRNSLRDLLKKIESTESRIEDARKESSKIDEEAKGPNKPKPFALGEGTSSGSYNNPPKEEDNLEFLLEDYTPGSSSACNENLNASKAETEREENYFGPKVFLCSRTHSQLSQLLGEIQKSPYKSLGVRVVSLASRQNYCVNESVLRLKHLPLINDKCRELRSKKIMKITKTSATGETLKRQKATESCPFFRLTNIENVKTKIITEIADIEDLISWGKNLNGCPYYASRLAIDEAQIVLVPYNTILHKSTREACGIDLKNSVVIIDEAHNLLDAIGNIHSCQVTGFQLSQSYNQLVRYRDRYDGMFSPLNLLHLNQLIFILQNLVKKLAATLVDDDSNDTPQNKPGERIETLADFVLSCEIDTINIHKVLEFINRSRLVNKLQGFTSNYVSSVRILNKTEKTGVSAFLETLMPKKEAEVENEKEQETDNVSGNSIISVISFIEILTTHCLDGRIITKKSTRLGTSSLKYILLNPASHLKDIVSEARSVVLVGGTMQPLSEFTDQLFYLAGGTPDRIATFTCGHVIPQNNILPIIVTSGPTGRIFDFTYAQRDSVHVQDEFGRLLSNVCNVVPAGIVCFFPSYDYENIIYEHLEKTKVIEKLSRKKKILREPRMSTEVDQVLKEYAAAARRQGAVLFSVVGGKLSEGLNFSDDLGRCVMVVGLPYPSMASVELKEKMNYLSVVAGPNSGKAYYESLCMKAVNQSIGRSVRHKDDYASVLLVDHRYTKFKYQNALPLWIQSSLWIQGNSIPLISKGLSLQQANKFLGFLYGFCCHTWSHLRLVSLDGPQSCILFLNVLCS